MLTAVRSAERVNKSSWSRFDCKNHLSLRRLGKLWSQPGDGLSLAGLDCSGSTRSPPTILLFCYCSSRDSQPAPDCLTVPVRAVVSVSLCVELLQSTRGAAAGLLKVAASCKVAAAAQDKFWPGRLQGRLCACAESEQRCPSVWWRYEISNQGELEFCKSVVYHPQSSARSTIWWTLK